MTAPYDYRKIPLYLIDLPNRRIRSERPERIETLAKDISVNGQLQPIIVVELEDGRFAIDDGALRVLALRSIKADEIDARVTKVAWLKPEERTVRGLMANLNREDYTAFERCEALHTLKHAYEALHPETRKGGDRKSETAKAKNQSEIFSFSSAAAEATGLSRRAIEIAVATFDQLSIVSRERIRGTWVEKKQSDLKALSEEGGLIQSAALDLVLGDQPEVSTVPEAISIAKGEKPENPVDKSYSSFAHNWSRFEIRHKRSFVAAYKAEIISILKEQGDLA